LDAFNNLELWCKERISFTFGSKRGRKVSENLNLLSQQSCHHPRFVVYVAAIFQFRIPSILLQVSMEKDKSFGATF
jgi:hypothetical protein